MIAPNPEDYATPRTRNARAFTLIEVVLAALIGSLVIVTAMALFGALARGEKAHQLRTAQINDFANAYRLIERTLQLLVMAERSEGADGDTRRRLERDLARTDGLLTDDDGTDRAVARFMLIEDPQATAAFKVNQRGIRPQTLRLSLRNAPVAGGFGATERSIESIAYQAEREQAQARERIRAERRSRRADSAADGGNAGGGGGGGGIASLGPDASPEQIAAALSASKSGGSGGEGGANGGADSADLDDTGTELEGALDAPRAPGVRAELLLLPDGETPTPGAQAATATGNQRPPVAVDADGERGWTLWYREVPPRSPVETMTPEERERAASGDASGLNAEVEFADLTFDASSLRTVRLLGGLRYAAWRVFRQGRFDTQMTALGPSELPAYVELELETLGGRRETWMFEVGWSQGAEPGQLLTLAPDALDQPLDPTTGNPSDPANPTNPQTGDGSGGQGGSGQGNGAVSDDTVNGGAGGPRVKPRDKGAQTNEVLRAQQLEEARRHKEAVPR